MAKKLTKREELDLWVDEPQHDNNVLWLPHYPDRNPPKVDLDAYVKKLKESEKTDK